MTAFWMCCSATIFWRPASRSAPNLKRRTTMRSICPLTAMTSGTSGLLGFESTAGLPVAFVISRRVSCAGSARQAEKSRTATNIFIGIPPIRRQRQDAKAQRRSHGFRTGPSFYSLSPTPYSLSLKRNIFVGDFGRLREIVLPGRWALVHVRRARRARRAAVASARGVVAPRQQRDVAGDDLGPIHFSPCEFLVLPVACLQPSFDKKLRPLLHVVTNNLSQARIGHNIVPLGAILPVALRILRAFTGRQSEAGHQGAAAGRTDFGILSNISQKKNSIHALCHILALLSLLPAWQLHRQTVNTLKKLRRFPWAGGSANSVCLLRES